MELSKENGQSHIVASVSKNPMDRILQVITICESGKTGDGLRLCDKNSQSHSCVAATKRHCKLSAAKNNLWLCIEKNHCHIRLLLSQIPNTISVNKNGINWSCVLNYSSFSLFQQSQLVKVNGVKSVNFPDPSPIKIKKEMNRVSWVGSSPSSYSVQPKTKKWLKVSIKYNVNYTVCSMEPEYSIQETQSNKENFLNLVKFPKTCPNFKRIYEYLTNGTIPKKQKLK